jgi:hypothetical protein
MNVQSIPGSYWETGFGATDSDACPVYSGMGTLAKQNRKLELDMGELPNWNFIRKSQPRG